ncbi:4-hydroxythreonine-4-phosphate dehydrogenase PdxA [Vagococcus salmoninarum]|uniref:4-hydroxythreonine-4-phosphate dehydrogenase PdxA n=1 Tax=Vagococcus salmoninarum TaxID=2739 RepID=A0A429ZK01_9ENTE|nr:4-hydroxythreonine-4-phosphate dehydrogenase PdxA [Vagococcus salmoninarum]RST93989.1 4-hydroxythreonine-4-phosphate dehydrogenase PdxA [Vagococcus salmoninarum]
MSYLGITMGDPAGIGPEVTVKALLKEPTYLDTTVIFGSPQIIAHYAQLLNSPYKVHSLTSLVDVKKGAINVYNVLDLAISQIPLGKVSALAGNAAYHYLATAIAFASKGDIDSIVTAPLNKAALHLGGHLYDGHTEILAKLTETATYTMMLWSEKFSVVHVSTHVSLAHACQLVTRTRIEECIALAHEAMLRLGISQPKIGVAGLNPHSGEGGLFGHEDQREIQPAIIAKRQAGFEVTGPLPPDTVFLKALKKEYDVVIAMYHDQGHIPMKLLAFDEGVNVTLGLPIIRTSVDHGTAFNIAGQGIANERSMLTAIKLAERLTTNI